MVSFVSDYIAGAHPEVLARLAETNLEPLPGYGADRYCESAKEKIRAACGLPDAEVFRLQDEQVLDGFFHDSGLLCVAIW